ncbi:ABC transporter substrate-binding protein [Neobacillus mesonae]|uniref:ABC transporter substrate-binding protein n=1 Tax=Neobacillus mesonae TaxID=1193713 RepID=UPI00203AFDB1|nr:ABC transporter substrate-binding protein [Neobacillus mesonae]MCM3568669.1 ABC transporter substrate-binding protein [Neobacillus mesonae]
MNKRKQALRKLMSFVGVVIVGIWLVLAILAPWLAPHDPNKIDTASKLIPPNGEYLFGTDNFGRDIFSRIIYGARVTILSGIAAIGIASFIGISLGAVAGYFGGKLGNVIMRIMDMLLAFPSLILAMAIAASIGPGLTGALIAVAVVSVPEFARLMYGQAIVIKEKEYIEASRAIGVSHQLILVRHVFPNAIAPLLVQISLSLGSAVLTTSSLSFIGLGVQPPTAEWGSMISYGRDYIVSGEWWMTTFPGLAIASVILGFISLGDGLSDWFNPYGQSLKNKLKQGRVNMKRRANIFILLFVMAAGLLLSACAENANQKANSNTKGTNQEGKGDNTITIAYSQGSGQTMDPHEAGDLTSASYAFALYDQLVTSGTEEKDGKKVGRTDLIKPSLAESWEISKDGLEYTFKLRDDVKFTSGKPVNADAVLYSFERVQTKGEGGSLYKLSNIKSVEKIDDKTVKFTLSKPNHLFLKYLATFTFSIVDPSVAKNNPDDYLTTHSAGSGAFKLESWDPATGAVFTANKNYWKGAPKADKVKIKYVKEASNRELFLENGDVDVALDIPAKDVKKLSAKDNMIISSQPTNRIVYMGMNANFKPFNDVKVRQAMNYVIDQDKIINDVVYGQGAKMTSSISHVSPAHTSNGYNYKYDLEKAKSLLSEAGYPNGFEFDLTVSSATQDYEDIAVILKSELEKIGVKMNIKLLAPAQYSETINGKKAAAFLGKYTSLVNDPAYHYGFLLASDGASNYAAYNSKEVDSLLAQAMNEQDEAKRTAIYQQVQQKVTADAPWAYLYESNLIAGFNKDVKGYIFYPDEIIRFVSLYK